MSGPSEEKAARGHGSVPSSEPVWELIGEGPLPEDVIRALAALLIDLAERKTDEAQDREAA